MELNKKAWPIIQEIKDLEEIDVIVWALTGAKKCSMFPDKNHYGPRTLEKRVIMRTIQALGLEYKDLAVQIKGWLAYDVFSKKYQKPGDQTDDLAAGLYYDIPPCCAEMFHNRNGERIKRLLASIDCSPEDFEHLESDRFFDKILKEATALILADELPPSLFLLMGQTYVPCSPLCENFIRQAERMFESLVIYLGRERTDEIVEKYKKRIIKIYK